MGLRVGATSRSPWAAIILGGVVAGTLDIGAAALINWASPALILRFVAGGLLGKTALDGGALVALLGGHTGASRIVEEDVMEPLDELLERHGLAATHRHDDVVVRYDRSSLRRFAPPVGVPHVRRL